MKKSVEEIKCSLMISGKPECSLRLRLHCNFRGKLEINQHPSVVIFYNIYNAFTFAHLNSRQNIGSENDVFIPILCRYMKCMVCNTSQRVLCCKCLEPFCGVSYDVNANLEHPKTVYFIHFRNAVFFF